MRGEIDMDYKKYSKATWIVTCILAAASITFDVLILTGVIAKGNDMMQQTSVITLLVAGYILIASIRALILKCRDEKQGKDQK